MKTRVLDWEMLRTLFLSTVVCLLTACGIEADALPYYQGTFIGSYLKSDDAAPVGMKLNLQASAIEQKRYTITGTAIVGEESFTAEGYELASYNLDYISSQAAPPPEGNSFIELQNVEGATVYTLCTSLYYRDYSSNLRVTRAALITGSPGDDPAYCSHAYYDTSDDSVLGIAYLTRQSY